MVIELGHRRVNGCTGIIGKKHHARRFVKAFREEVSEPQLVALCPGILCVTRATLEVEAVDCHNAGRTMSQSIEAI